MGLFDNLFGGSDEPVGTQTVTTASDPWAAQQPHLQNIFAGAKAAYESAAPSYYPHSTVVEFSPQTEQALTGMEQRALAGSPLQQAGMETMRQAAAGEFLAPSPYLQDAITAATQPLMQQFQTQIAPGIDSSFAGAGRMGSGLYAQQRNLAEDTLARNMSDMATKMAYDNYQKERQYQMQASQLAPTMAQADYADLGQLAQVGAAREGQAGKFLQDSINRFQFEQNRPWEQLGRYSGLVQGNYGGTQTQSTPMYQNTAANTLGGALGGAQIGSMIGGQSGAGWGAGIGGLLGMFG